jgi:hypothetical protein
MIHQQEEEMDGPSFQEHRAKSRKSKVSGTFCGFSRVNSMIVQQDQRLFIVVSVLGKCDCVAAFVPHYAGKIGKSINGPTGCVHLRVLAGGYTPKARNTDRKRVN